MPFYNGSCEHLELFTETLDAVQDLVDNYSTAAPIVIMGDFNTTLPQTATLKSKWFHVRPYTVKILITHTLFVGRVVVGTWMVCGLSKGSPCVGYQWVSDGSSVGHRWDATRPPSTWHTHNPQASHPCPVHPLLHTGH